MKEKILEKLIQAQDSVKLVKYKLPKNYENFIKMERLMIDGIYKNIEFAIQNILDICAIILKEKDLDVPASDEDMLAVLERNKVFNKSVIIKISEIKGFRNLLVHRYGRIDDKIAYKDIKEGMKDFEIIFKELRKFLKKL